MGTLIQDLRYGLRQLRRSPGFTTVAVITLALGIGANTAYFSVMNAILRKPFPYKSPNRLVMVWEKNLKQEWETVGASAPNFLDWRAQNHSFEQLAAFQWPDSRSLGGESEAEEVSASGVTANFFSALGVTPAPGRNFTLPEERVGHNHVVIISRKLWQRRFASGAGVLGKTITLDGDPYIVVGIAPPLHPDFDADVYVPLPFGSKELGARGERTLAVVGRLKQATQLTQAQAEMDAILPNLSRHSKRVSASALLPSGPSRREQLRDRPQGA